MSEVGEYGALRFTAYPTPVRAHLDASLTPIINKHLHGWLVLPEHIVDAAPDIEILAKPEGRYTVRVPWVGQSYTLSDKVDCACSFFAEILRFQANSVSGIFCMHSAAAAFDGRAIIFPGDFRAGKSTLMAVLASRGSRILSDDAIFVSPETAQAVSSGVSPRLRLPLPVDFSSQTQSFLSNTLETKGKRYGYLALPEALQADNRSALPIGAIVIPKRENGSATQLVSLSKEQALRAVIWHNFARNVPARQILHFLSRLVEQRPAFELHYANAEDAADVLVDSFHDWPEQETPISTSGDVLPSDTDSACTRLQASQDILDYQVDSGHFIADENTGRVYHLNETAGAIWRMLRAGESADNVAILMSTAFPEQDADEIGRDVVALSHFFRENGLLMRVPPHAPD